MLHMTNRLIVRFLGRILGVVLGAGLGLWLGRVLLLPLGVALVLVYLLLPPVSLLERRLPGWLAIILVYAGVVLLLLLLWRFAVPQLLGDFAALSALVPDTLAGGQTFLQMCGSGVSHLLGEAVDSQMWRDMWRDCLVRFAAGLGEVLYGWLKSGVCVLPEVCGELSLLVFAPVFAFYILRDRKDFMRFLRRVLGRERLGAIRPLFDDINGILRGFVRGYLLVALCVGGLFYLLLWFLGVDYAFTLGLIMALAELIPYIGPFIAFVPCILLVLVQGGGAVVKMLAIWVVVQQLENLVISPHIMSDAVRLHPLYVIMAVIVGGSWWGVPGMILAVPLAASLRPVIRWLVERWRYYRREDGEKWIF